MVLGPFSTGNSLLPQRQFFPKGIYFGYYIVGAAFIAQFVAIGMYSYVLGSFMDPMLNELGWSRSDFTLTRSIGQCVMAFVGVFVGVRVDRYGGRPIMLVGGILLSVSLCLHSWVQTLWQWWILNGVIVTAGCAMLGNLVVNVTLSKWFVEQRGLAIAIAAMGISFGGIVLTPLATWLIDTIGWRESWLWLGVGTAVFVLPVALLVRRSPEDYGLHPDGHSPEQIAQGQGQRAKDELARSFTRAQALRTFSFYALVIAFGFFSINIVVMLLQTVPYLTDNGFTRSEAAYAIVVASIPAMLSKPVWGYLIDRSPTKPLAALSASLTGVALALIVFSTISGQLFWVYAAFFLLGVGWGGMIPMQEVIWASFFGRRFLGAIRGAGMPFSLALGAMAPWFSALYRDAYGDYGVPFMVVAGLNIFSGVLIFFAPPPQKLSSKKTG